MIWLPNGHRWKELLLAEQLPSGTGVTWPSAIRGGNVATLSNQARKASSSDGVRFVTGVATSNINLGAIHDNENILWVSFWFRPSQTHSNGSTAKYLWGKYDDADNYLVAYLHTDGTLVAAHREAAGAVESVASSETSWTVNTWYHVTIVFHNVNGQKIVVNGGTAQTAPANTTAVSLTAVFCIGARDDGTDTTGLQGTIRWFQMGVTDPSANNLADMAKGYTGPTPTQLYTLDEGRGATANDRGSGSNNGTLDSTCFWSYGSVRQPLLSLDGINDYASLSSRAAGGAITWVWVGRVMQTMTLSGTKKLYRVNTGPTNYFQIYSLAGGLRVDLNGNGVGGDVSGLTGFTVNSYVVLVATNSTALNVYRNGVLLGTDSTSGVLPDTAQNHFIGTETGAAEFDINQPMVVGIADGAMSAADVLRWSRRIDRELNLGVSA